MKGVYRERKVERKRKREREGTRASLYSPYNAPSLYGPITFQNAIKLYDKPRASPGAYAAGI